MQNRMYCFPSCTDGYKMIIPNLRSIINKKLEDSMEREKQITEKCQSTYTKGLEIQHLRYRFNLQKIPLTP